MAQIKIKLTMSDALRDKIREVNNPVTMLAIHNALAKRCDPYVPMRSGVLAQPTITADGVTYTQPYARYQYYGQVYGPNIPIRDKETGEITGWFSPAGKKKHPTGKLINYSTEYHPLATAFWDKAMLRDHGDEFLQEIKDILDWRMMQAERRR